MHDQTTRNDKAHNGAHAPERTVKLMLPPNNEARKLRTDKQRNKRRAERAETLRRKAIRKQKGR